MSANSKLAKLPGARRVGRAWIRAQLLDLGKYSGALRYRESQVFGELWEFARQAESLHRLDEYEGFFPDQPQQNLFERRRVRVHLGDRILTAWAYLLARHPTAATVIQAGDWRAHLRALKQIRQC